MSAPAVSELPDVCVINYNGSRYLPESLGRVRELRAQFGRVAFVDDASTDDSVAVARKALGDACFVALPLNRGPGLARNAGLAARNGVIAARLAQRGFTASPHAIDGPQGYLAVMDSEHDSLDAAVTDLGIRWEILDTGVTVKLYPSCAATHPPLDALFALKQRERITADKVQAIDVEVDSMTPRLLIHPDPATGLEAKFSMPFCAAAAIVYERIGIDTFDSDHIRNPIVQGLMTHVTLRANEEFDQGAPLARARVGVYLRDGRVVSQAVDGARGYPGRLTDEELATKFAGCATRTLSEPAANSAWAALSACLVAAKGEGRDKIDDVRELTALLSMP